MKSNRINHRILQELFRQHYLCLCAIWMYRLHQLVLALHLRYMSTPTCWHLFG